jgi:uracil-DNA glycosylase
MPNIELTLVIGQYAQNWHLHHVKSTTLTETILGWRNYWPNVMPLPHPSPRNNIWLKANPCFTRDVVPALQERVSHILGAP